MDQAGRIPNLAGGWLLVVSGNLLALLPLLMLEREQVILRTVWLSALGTLTLVGFLLTVYGPRVSVTSESMFIAGLVLKFIMPPAILVFLVDVVSGVDSYGAANFYPESIYATLLGGTMLLLACHAHPLGGSSGSPGVSLSIMVEPAPVWIILAILAVSAAAKVLIIVVGAYWWSAAAVSDFMFENPLYSPLGQMAALSGRFLVAYTLLNYLCCREREGSGQRLGFFILAAGVEILYNLPSGSRGGVIVPILVIFLAWVYVRGRVPLIPTVVCSVALFAFVTVWGVHRGIMAPLIKNEQGNLATNIEVIKALVLTWDESVGAEPWAHVVLAVDRLNDGQYLAVLIQRFGTVLPHLWGETYQKLVYTLVPRFLFGGALPPTNLGMAEEWMGRDMSAASAPSTLFGEAYLNFGWAGILLVPFLFGLWLRFYDGCLHRWSGDVGVKAVAILSAVMMADFVVQSMATTLGYMWKLLAVAWVFHLLRKRAFAKFLRDFIGLLRHRETVRWSTR